MGKTKADNDLGCSWLKTKAVEIKKNPGQYWLIFLILSFSAFFRIFRLHQLLGFWYDQGRDALVIWDLIHYGKFFLIGPVTGIDGIYLGPFYYYLIAPFYWLGGGSPVFTAACLSWLTVGAIFLIFLLAKKIYGPKVALLAAFIYGFSYNLIVFSRWLSNPNPLPFFTLLAILCFYFFISGRGVALVGAALMVGLSLQLEAASAFWFLPTTVLILFWQRRKISIKYLSLAFIVFVLTLAPQIVFDLRHQGVLRSAFRQFLVADKSFSGGTASQLTLLELVKSRLGLYFDVFFSKLFPQSSSLRWAAVALFSASLIVFRKKIFSSGGKLLALWVIVPLAGFFFYRGNHGYIWDYYFTGFVPAFIILFSAGLVFLWQKGLSQKVAVGGLMALFLLSNIRLTKNYLKTGIGITLRAQLWAIDWVYKRAGNKPFNIDVYVPPQIYYAYSYLFRWYGRGKYQREPETELVADLYTLYESDGEHPQFLTKWLKRQETIGRIVESDSWGDITVQKRERINFGN